jgi:diadenosine tetraphosphate (Ap4A) HIT family hydrolase
MATEPNCDICARIALFNHGRLESAVARLRSGYVWLFGLPYPRGYTLFAANRCVAELHDLDSEERSLFLEEMALVAEGVYRAFEPVKLNYELLGNST